MADYIEREALLELYDMGKELEEYAGVLSVPIPVIRQNIKDMPAADVVPVVRCKNCVHCEEERTVMGYVPFCLKWIMNTTEDGYCHEGVAISGAKMDGDT